MASAADIPPELLTAERRDAFLNWCRRLPVATSTKRRLLLTWKDATGARLTAADYKSTLTTKPTG